MMRAAASRTVGRRGGSPARKRRLVPQLLHVQGQDAEVLVLALDEDVLVGDDAGFVAALESRDGPDDDGAEAGVAQADGDAGALVEVDDVGEAHDVEREVELFGGRGSQRTVWRYPPTALRAGDVESDGEGRSGLGGGTS